MRKFRDEGHELFIVTPTERRFREKTKLNIIDHVNILQVKTLNIQKANIIEKGIGTLLIEYQFLNAINKHLNHKKFDLILYSTPPITLTKVIIKIKKKDGAGTYLLLKDIFPQNAVDLGMIKKNSYLHKYFRKKEKLLYSISDFIGCMSPANIDYIKRNNPQLDPAIIEENPNSIEIVEITRTDSYRKDIFKKYNILSNSTVLLYGGNFGKPQGIDFLIKVLESHLNNSSVFFFLVGSGTEYKKLNNWFTSYMPSNAILIPGLPKADYDLLVQACDVGMIFLDNRFTIPNFPSRLLSYLENKLPVLVATDENSDMGIISERNNFRAHLRLRGG